MSIFRAYDIRGIYGKELTDEIAKEIAKGFLNLINARKVVIGMDVRTSSPKIKKSIISGLISQGCQITDIGLVPVPVFYYFIVKYKFPSGIYITASHDPPNYNGLKLCKKRSIDITYESGISELEEMYLSGKFASDLADIKKPQKRFKIVKRDVSKIYEKHLIKKIKVKKPLHVVIDAGNGCQSQIAPEVFEKIGCKVTRLFCKFDGRFPNRSPEPTEKNLKELRKRVKKEKADLGIAYDNDGDRVIFIDDKGKLIEPDLILILFARRFLKKGDKLIADVRCTRALEKESKKNHWNLIWSRVGRSYIKQKMIKNKIILGGELTGHYYFKENNYYDDGLFSSLLLAEILSREDKSLSSLIKEVPDYPSLDFRFRCKDEKKFKVVEKFRNIFKGYRLILIDGVGIKFKNGFALVRASNTEPKIEVRLEAKTKSDLTKIKRRVLQKLKVAIK